MYGGVFGTVARRARWLALASGLAIVALVTSTVAPVTAAPAMVEPNQIVLTAADLPPGFFPDPSYMGPSYVDNVGPSERALYKREITRETVNAGPILVQQLIIRLDGDVGAGEALQIVRNVYTQRSGYSPSREGPNDGGTFTLEKFDDPVKYSTVGFIKENMIIVTTIGGIPQVTTAAGALQLAGISSAKLDAALGR